MSLFLLLISLGIVAKMVLAGTPAPAQYFHQQIVDHLNPKSAHDSEVWTQRYYTWDREFQGPGHPIFIILGGEGHIPKEIGLFYPFVTHHLAKTFGAYVLEPEHRFYGESQPLAEHRPRRSGQDTRVDLFTSEQALYDAMHLLEHIRKDLNCSEDKFSKDYCPVITVGGSYPGFLSAMARVLFPGVVDMAYAASAPMGFYSQQVHASDYYNHITYVAEKIFPGCAEAVRTSLQQVKQAIFSDDGVPYRAMGICDNTLPNYIMDPTTFANELFMVVGFSFANDNMANYPPSNQTRLYEACSTFSSPNITALTKVKKFLVSRLAKDEANCWDMKLQLPTGKNATISGGDWSGDGTGADGESWDFQTCTLLVEAIGFSENSMFPPRDWTLDWLIKHCRSRFGVTPKPYNLVRRWRFDDLVSANVTRIIFTNGLNDGWSVGGIKQNLSDSLIALNFPNGAHHSDLSGKGPSDEDTEDIKQGYQSVRQILAQWLDEIRPPLIEKVPIS
jgi:hypothetical protein